MGILELSDSLPVCQIRCQALVLTSIVSPELVEITPILPWNSSYAGRASALEFCVSQPTFPIGIRLMG